MKHVIALGKPTHFVVQAGVAACGLVAPDYSSNDRKKVDCLSCRRTKAWRGK